MASMLPGLIFVLLAASVIFTVRYFTQSSARELVAESFVGQHVTIDGNEVCSDDLRILYRWPVMAQWNGFGGFSVLNTQWLCQTRDGLYVLAIATSSGLSGDVQWAWRPLNEERARALLFYKHKAYKAVFGESPQGNGSGGNKSAH